MFDLVHDCMTGLLMGKRPVFRIKDFIIFIEVVWLLVPSLIYFLRLIIAELVKKIIIELQFA